MDVHALGAHRTYNKHAVNSVTYAMRLIARLIDDTVTSWLSNKTHFITSHNVACKAIFNTYFIHNNNVNHQGRVSNRKCFIYI